MALIRFISGIAVQYPRVYLKQIPSYILPKANSVVYGEGRIWPSNAFSDSCLHSLPPMSFVTWLYARKHPTRSPSQKSLRRRRINGRSAEFSLPSACSPAVTAAAAPPLPPACSNTPPKIGTEAAAPSETTTAAEPRTDALGPSSGPNHAPRLGLSLLGKFSLVKGNLNHFVCEIMDLFDLLFYLSGGIARPQIAVALAVLSSPRSPFALA